MNKMSERAAGGSARLKLELAVTCLAGSAGLFFLQRLGAANAESTNNFLHALSEPSEQFALYGVRAILSGLAIAFAVAGTRRTELALAPYRKFRAFPVVAATGIAFLGALDWLTGEAMMSGAVSGASSPSQAARRMESAGSGVPILTVLLYAVGIVPLLVTRSTLMKWLPAMSDSEARATETV